MIYEFLFLGITNDNVYLLVKKITRERMLNLGDRNRFKIIQGCHFQDHRISRHLASVLRETQPFDFFFSADIAVKYVARTFQAAIQLPFDMHTPCRVSLAHLSPRNTLSILCRW